MTISYSNEEIDSEANKLSYDFFKHLTTLNTGSILIIITFLQGFLNTPESKLIESKLLIFCLGGFTISLISSVQVMYAITNPTKNKKLNFITSITHLISWFSFLFGILMLIFFTVDIICNY